MTGLILGPSTGTSWILLLMIIIYLSVSTEGSREGDQKTYIVYMGHRLEDNSIASSLHTDILQQVIGSSRASESLIQSYKKSFNGFVAKLTEEESSVLASMEAVVSVFPNEKKELHTTRSWDFMGFPQEVKRTRLESDVIIGMLDTGIWPESDSFSDDGIGPPPSKWKGTCKGFTNFTCNNKIIGAKFYRSNGEYGPGDIKSPRDTEGHGTHTSSTAAGKERNNASYFGLGSGTARGGVPSARIAVYKICWSDGCWDADILAAFDDAIADGVDIISVSFGAIEYCDYFNDSIAIGAFHAMKNGILTSNSAGNSGPILGGVSNFSPWSLSVAASSTDRKFVTKVVLGNGQVYKGTSSLNIFNLRKKMYPLVYGRDVPDAHFDGSLSRYCSEGTLNETMINGTIVLCDGFSDPPTGIFHSGAVATIMQDISEVDYSNPYPLPASYISVSNKDKIPIYINSTRHPKATIQKTSETRDKWAPRIASFSSRGPNPITPEILKPDLSAPGVDILASWSQGTAVTGIHGENKVVPYNIISGTSMSCPHATAAAAYVKSFHPEWSPAAIKSALMTTAIPMKDSSEQGAEFANGAENQIPAYTWKDTNDRGSVYGYGAGHINPTKAVNPGLVYDAGESDYVRFLCGQGYSDKLLKLVTGDKASGCSKANNATVYDLNYPSFAIATSVKVSSNMKVSTTRVFHRTVTNVGSAKSTYKVVADVSVGLKVVVKPRVLSFESFGQKKSFVVIISSNTTDDIASGYLMWDDGMHKVRSPIAAYVEKYI